MRGEWETASLREAVERETARRPRDGLQRRRCEMGTVTRIPSSEAILRGLAEKLNPHAPAPTLADLVAWVPRSPAEVWQALGVPFTPRTAGDPDRLAAAAGDAGVRRLVRSSRLSPRSSTRRGGRRRPARIRAPGIGRDAHGSAEHPAARRHRVPAGSALRGVAHGHARPSRSPPISRTVASDAVAEPPSARPIVDAGLRFNDETCVKEEGR